MTIRECEHCGKKETEGYLYSDLASNRTLCMCCKFVLDAKNSITSRIVYLACPYSHEREDVREARFAAANMAAGYLVAHGYGVISPISHGHPITQTGRASGNWSAWEAVDKRMLDASDALIVLNIKGLAESEGVRAEVLYAIDKGKPVTVMTPVGNVYNFLRDDDSALFLTLRLEMVPGMGGTFAGTGRSHG